MAKKKNELKVTVNRESEPVAVRQWVEANKEKLFVTAGYQEGSWIYLKEFSVDLKDEKYKPIRAALKEAGFTFGDTKRRGPVWYHRTFGHELSREFVEQLNL